MLKTIIKNNNLQNIAGIISCSIISLIGILAIIPGINPDVKAETFRYFTTLSNLFMSFVSLVCIPFYVVCLNDDDYKFPKWLKVLKLIGTSMVFLTFITVICFLGIIYGYNMMFDGFQLIIYHLIEPLLSTVFFIFLDLNVKIKSKTTLLVLIPVLAYGVLYLVCNLCHIWVKPDGTMTDHYNLFQMPFMFPILVLVVYLSALGLWALNNLVSKKFLTRVSK